MEPETPPDQASGLAALLPAGVCLHQVWIAAGPWPLQGDEAAAVARAVPKRQREFAAGRHCARQALQQLGWPPQAIATGADRAPQWPAGLVGSITHDDELCAAAVASAAAFDGLGIDVDQPARFGLELAATICAAPEAQAWRALADDAQRRQRLAALFTAKEAVFKAQYPRTGAWLDFHDLQVAWAGDAGDFSATLQRAAGGFAAGHVFHGRSALTASRASAAVWF